METTRKRVATDQIAYDLTKKAVEAEEKKNKAGTGSTLAVEQELLQESRPRSTSPSRRRAERQAVASYDRSLGTTLERYHVKLSYD